MRIATFNVQNLRLRHPMGHPRFDGARDGDAARDSGLQAAALDLADRRLTAAVLAHADADVICLQEVFDLEALDFFHDHLLRHAGGHAYPYRFCFPGNDGGGRDVALMSRLPVDEVVSHAGLTAADLGLEELPGRKAGAPVFRRDCLMAQIGDLTIFLCHFKAPWPDARVTWPVRRREALAVRRLIERRFPNGNKAFWLVLGDLNEPDEGHDGEPAIAPLTRDFAVDLVERLPESERWTYYEPASGGYLRLDYLLAAPALAEKWLDARPDVLREGLSREAARYQGPRLPGVGRHRPRASDHAALVVEFAGL
ncbi:endonuclease/exonuclease/phosphatase family protein [Taklimakanibacter lacteus]|uniref:endonuclease/exonuclease/phosphatase family protein n=1 Tax=Taklimakanibacter lacteus TaxID=2268456 RepID=UPI000E674DB8